MFQIECIYDKPWRESELLKIELRLDCEVKVSPNVAQRKANGFFGGEVTLMVSSGSPMLILGERPVWRVPALLRLSGHGEIGTVGAVDVDAQTGEVLVPAVEQIQRMQDIAHALAAYFTSPATSAR